ncbi:hypothetical protein JW968_02000 [Candidatus Woesearchaeota archaeon]|nr:hypothetical protein [Candidatus Woesearchaeota archaeon]
MERHFVHILEMLVGWLIIPRVITFFWVLLVPYLGLSAQAAIIVKLVISAAILLLCFVYRKALALGFLIAMAWDVTGMFMALN